MGRIFLPGSPEVERGGNCCCCCGCCCAGGGGAAVDDGCAVFGVEAAVDP